MAITDIHGSTLAIVAGFLNMEEKANFAATCRHARGAAKDNPSAWWGGDDVVVTVNDFNVRSFIKWAATVSTPALIRKLVIEVNHASFKDKVALNMVAPKAVSPRELDIEWRTYYRLEGFTRVDELLIDGDALVHVFPAMLPPNLRAMKISFYEFVQLGMWLPSTVQDLTLDGAHIKIETLSAFNGLYSLTLKECVVLVDENDVACTVWKTLDIKHLSFTLFVSDDDGDDVYMDSAVPLESYPSGLRSLTFVVDRPKGWGMVYMRSFTKEALHKIDHVGVHLQGDLHFDHNWATSSVGGLTIDGVTYPNVFFDFSRIKHM